MLHGLRDEISEDDILQELYGAEIQFKDVRIVRNKIGYTKGFGFVEFDSAENAKEWMDYLDGPLNVLGYAIGVEYSRPRTGQEKDWSCVKCGTQNFSSRKRNTCFHCGEAKPESSGKDEKDIYSAPPCKVLIFKGLDVLTNEEAIRKALSAITVLPIYDIRLIRDKLTSTSRGFCFVEMASVEEATKLLEQIISMNPPLEIDGRLIAVLYAKNSEPTPASKTNSNVAAAAIEQAQWSSTSAQPSSTAAAITQSTGTTQQQAYAAAYQYHTDQQATASTDTTGTTTTDTAAETTEATATDATASFVYDASSGYYYDATTGLYYDANTGYYYNATTGQYFYWDDATQQYVEVNTNGAAATTDSSNTAPDPSTAIIEAVSSKEKQKKAKSLQAKKIAKDMQRWAKNVNASKPQRSAPTAPATSAPEERIDEPEFKKPIAPPPKASSALSIAKHFANMPQLPNKVTSSPLSAMTFQDEPAPSPLGTLAEYGDDDDSDTEEDPSNQFADLKLMACLLCKRQLPSKEALDKHMQFSDLHKQNLEIHKKMGMTEKQREEYERKEREAKYRDRAKERRDKYGQSDASTPLTPPSNRKRKGFAPLSPYEQPTKARIPDDNVGNQMLKAMGWSEGRGLGKDGQGIVDPIQAKMRTQNAGLGLKGSSYGNVTGGESDRERHRKLAYSRFHDA